MNETGTILWKIGSSVVLTVPSRIVKELSICTDKIILAVSMTVGKDSISFVAKPWKCGGSFVVTVPATYVEVYNLNDAVKSKVALNTDIKKAQCTKR